MRIILLAFFLLSACVSMPTKVAENISLGATSNKVESLLGSPDSFSNEFDGVNTIIVWSYFHDEMHCGFRFIQGLVAQFGCEPIDNPKLKGIAGLSRVLNPAPHKMIDPIASH